MLILDNYHPLLRFFQLPLTRPQPAVTAVLSSFSWKLRLLLVFKQIFSHLMWWQRSPVDSTPSLLLGCSLLCHYYVLVVFVNVYSYYCMCQNLSFPYIFTIHSPVLSEVCFIQKPSWASSTMKHHLCLWVLWWSPVFQIFPQLIEFISVWQSHS